MLFRQLGETDLNCSLLGLGTGRLASVSGGLSSAAALRLIHGAADLGVNLIDTADSYAQGQCEKMIASALKGRRSQFIIVSKAGYSFSSLGGGLRLLKPLAKRILKYVKGGKNLAGNVRANVSRQDFSPMAIRNAVVGSLQRLQIDHLDLFLLHSPTLAAISDPALLDLLRALKQEGKIRYFGISSPDASVLEIARQIKDLSAIQTPVSPVQTVGPELLSHLATAKKSVIANQIFLSGKLIGNEAPEHSSTKTTLTALAAAKGISLNHLLIKYALAQPAVTTVLSGTTNPAHLQANVADALSPNILSHEDLAAIDTLCSVGMAARR